MATTQIYLKGKCKHAHTFKPDPKYGKYGLLLYPDAESLDIIKKLKDDKPAILNELKRDADGDFMRFTCEPNKNIGGKIQVFQIEVLKPDGTPLTEALIGNGSDVTIKLDNYTYRKGEGRAVRLRAVRVDNLIPYVKERDFTPEQTKTVAGLEDQPKPLF